MKHVKVQLKKGGAAAAPEYILKVTLLSQDAKACADEARGLVDKLADSYTGVLENESIISYFRSHSYIPDDVAEYISNKHLMSLIHEDVSFSRFIG